MPGETSLGAAALVIALVALAISTEQLLQQIFSTAEGYRRCQPSVLGPWAKYTRLRWRWSQFRFEVIYTTPRIELVMLPFNKTTVRKWPIVMPECPKLTGDTAEIASWILLLASLSRSTDESLTRLSRQTKTVDDILTVASLTSVERSWDFMPPDVSRPMALTTIHCISVIAVRLGMTWKDVRPTEGVMTAEGNGYTLSSSLVRGVGLVLSFASEGHALDADLFSQRPNLPQDASVYRLVPTIYADTLAFGIITTDTRWTRCSFGSSSEILQTLHEIDRTGSLVDMVLDFQQRQGDRFPGLSDFVCMTCIPLRIRQSTMMCIPQPIRDALGTINSVMGSIYYHRSLERFVSKHGDSASQQSKQILSLLSELDKQWPQWETSRNYNRKEPPVEFLDAIHNILDYARGWLDAFRRTSEDHDDLYHFTLIKHLEVAVRFAQKERENAQKVPQNARRVVASYASEMQNFFKDDFAEFSDLYRFGGLCHMSRDTVIDVWLTLVCRGICWARLHWILIDSDFSAVPSRYYRSKLPVYIG